MSLNILEARTVFQDELDKQMMEKLTSSFMDANAGGIIYNGGSEIKIPSIVMDGLRDYDRASGYKKGAVSLSYETYKMKMDRGTSFLLDRMDVDETNFVANAGLVMGEFQRTKVVPEIDAYRYSSIYKEVKEEKADSIVAKNLTEKDIFKAITNDIALIRDKCGGDTQLVVVMNGLTKAKLENSVEFTKFITQTDFKIGEISTKVSVINDCPIINVPSERMYTEYDFFKGGDEDENSGFKKKDAAKLISYIIMPKNAAIAVCKQDNVKIIDPDNYQTADAWFIGYRKYHDIWLKKSSLEAIKIVTEA